MIELQGLSYTYPGSGRPAVSKLSLQINPGELTLLSGSNGSGKSTLTKLILGLLEPDEGSIQVDGKSASDERRGLIGLVRQDPRSQLIASIIDEEVAFGPENLGISREEIRERVAAALRKAGLSGFDNRNPDTLSAGQQQRLAIAGVLALNPKYILFDEASSMLDPAGREDFYQLCAELAASGTGVVSISHFPDEALRADRMLVMENGELAAQGDPVSLFRQKPDLKRPFLLKLSEALRDRGLALPRDIRSHEDLISAIRTRFLHTNRRQA